MVKVDAFAQLVASRIGVWEFVSINSYYVDL